MKKILIIGGNSMLAYDFKKYFSLDYKVYYTNSNELNITDYQNIINYIEKINPNIVLNFAAYTNVDDAEDIGMKTNYDVNTIGVYNIAKITKKYNIDLISISSDYVFSGNNEKGYNESDDITLPVNQYGMAKYLGEELAIKENGNTIIIRTSWLYGGEEGHKNFVNTMLNLGRKGNSLNVINDQFGSPTNCKDLSIAIESMIKDIPHYRGQILHLSNSTKQGGITWYEFAREIFRIKSINIDLKPCASSDFKTKANRPKFSKLINNSNITLRGWREGLEDYLSNI